MPTLEHPRFIHWQKVSAVRVVCTIVLVVVLFAATLNSEEIYVVFGHFWQTVFAAVGNAHHPPTLLQSHGAIGQLTHRERDIPAVVSYSILYIAGCLLLLYLVLPYPSQRRLVRISYGLAGALTLLLLLASISGNPDLIVLNTRLIHFIVSPMPVIVLAPLLWWYIPKESPR